MSCVRSLLGLTSLASALLLASPTFAATNYCDNDPPQTQCGLDNWGFKYAYYSGDQNGDDRRSSDANTGYSWLFKSQHWYAFYVWLANPYFTDTAANYYVQNGASWNYLGSINQNTAPNGWSFAGYGYGSAIAVLHGNSTTGADMARGDYSSLTAASEATAGDALHAQGTLVLEPRLAAIQQKMLNAVDNFSDASGSFHIAFSNNGQDEDVDFEVSPKHASSFVRVTRANGEVVENATNGQSSIELRPGESSYQMKQLAKLEPLQSPRQFRDEKGDAVYQYRQDPTWAIGASEVTLPQNYAFWLSNSDAKIVGHARLVGRNATVIAGHHDAYLADKLRASTFKMWVDDATGVLLKLRGTDAAGRVMYYIDVQDLKFDSGIDLHPAIKAPVGWTNASKLPQLK